MPLWLRRLPHNLSTLRLRFQGGRLRIWRWHFQRDISLPPGDADYLFHVNYVGVTVCFGPLWFALGLVDTD